jgi:hypothetical protein
VLVGEAKMQILTVFGLTYTKMYIIYRIVLKKDILFVPSGQSLRSECHTFKLIRGC